MAKAATAHKPRTEDQPGGPAQGPSTAKPAQEIVKVNKSAMSLDVGPTVIKSLVEVSERTEELERELGSQEVRRRDALMQLMTSFVKAAQNDNGIDLSKAFSTERKEWSPQLDKLLLAIGVYQVVPVKDKAGKETGRFRLDYTDSVRNFFPGSLKDKDTDPAYAKKNSVRTRFLEQCKKSAQGAQGVIARGIKIEADKKSGTLRVSGKAIKEHFGEDEVLLDEKQKVIAHDKQGKEKVVQLKVKPSYTALAQIGAKSIGKVLTKRPDARVAGGGVDPEKALINGANDLAASVNRYSGEITDAVRKALNAVVNAIATKLES